MENTAIIPTSLFESVREALRIQANTPVEITEVKTIEKSITSNVDIIAAIGMESSQTVGTVAVCFPKTTFLNIINQMLGENNTEITSENSDAAGEILNIVYASARAKINEAGHDFSPALPTTTHGQNIQVTHAGNSRIVRATCQTQLGNFYLELSFRKKEPLKA